LIKGQFQIGTYLVPQRQKNNKKGGEVNFITRLNYYILLVGARGFECAGGAQASF
jgi:hypothetical protein